MIVIKYEICICLVVALILEIIIILIQLSYIFLKEQIAISIQLLLHTSYGAIHIIKIYKYFLIVFFLFEEKLKEWKLFNFQQKLFIYLFYSSNNNNNNNN